MEKSGNNDHLLILLFTFLINYEMFQFKIKIKEVINYLYNLNKNRS